MDINLGHGHMDGTEAAEIILQKHNIPIVFLSSHTEPEVVDKTEKIISYGYVVKNSGETVLLASIKMAFKLHQAHMERLEKSNQLDTILNNAEDFISRLDREKRHLYVNQAFCTTMGISRQECIGKTIRGIGYPSDLAEKWNNAVDLVFTTGKAAQIEYRLHAFGNEIVLDSKIVPELVECGIVRTVVVISRDVSARKNIETAIWKSEELFSKAFHSGPLLMTIRTIEDGTYLEVNNNFIQVTGYERKEVLGKTSTKIGIITPQDWDTLKETLLKENRISGWELTLKRKNGDPIHCTYFGEIIEVAGKKQLLSITEDITAKKHSQRLIDLMRFCIEHASMILIPIIPKLSV